MGINLTRDLKNYLTELPTIAPKEYVPNTVSSIYELAKMNAMTLSDYVREYQDRAVADAEQIFSYWDNLLTQAAVSGVLTDKEKNTYEVNKTMKDLLIKKVTSAKEDLEAVMELLVTTATAEEARKDHIIRVMYRRAVSSNNIKALTYLIDRVEGRVPEANGNELDYNNSGQVYAIICSLFQKQLDLLNVGTGPRMAMCSRKSGKTYAACALMLIEGLRNKNTTCLYIGETALMGEELVGEAMNNIIDRCNLTDSKGRRLQWKHLENGSKIMVRGLSNTKDPDMIRGLNARVIVIDEFFHLKSDLLAYMQDEVLEPMMLPFTDYKYLMIGTPPETRGTYGEMVWNERKMPKFHWTMFDNPAIPDPEKFIQERLKEKGLSPGCAFELREYRGKIAYDDDYLVYPEYRTFAPEAQPDMPIDNIYIGIDYGVNGETGCNAIIAVAWNHAQKRGYVVYETKFSILTCEKEVTMLERLKRSCYMLWEYALDFFPTFSREEANKRVFWFADTSDQQLAQEIMYNVKLEGVNAKIFIAIAHKHDATMMRDKIRDCLRTGALLLPEKSEVERECMMTIFKRVAGGGVSNEVDMKHYHPDLLPALRYAMWPAIGNRKEVEGGTSILDKKQPTLYREA